MMNNSPSIDSNSSWTEPLLVTAITLDRQGDDESHLKVQLAGDLDSSKSVKRCEQQQLHVRRLFSFFLGSMVGIVLQLASVLVFARLIQHAHYRHGNEITALLRQSLSNTATRNTEEQAMVRFEAIRKSEDSTWFNMALWLVFHASLSVYLMFWVVMMTLAVSKVGWRFISSGLRLPSHVTRRTCFLRTFFFINGTFDFFQSGRRDARC
jgi:hypothetical protein